MTSVRRTASALLAVPLLALGACAGEEPEPEPEPIMPTKSASSSPSASEPSPTPQPWEAKTDDGAVAFVEHWYDLVNDARLDGVTEPLAAASTQNCETCQNFVDISARVHQPGGVYESKPWKVLGITSPNRLQETVWEMAVRVKQPAARQKLPEDSAVTRFGGGRETVSATIQWKAGEWKMHELAVLR